MLPTRVRRDGRRTYAKRVVVEGLRYHPVAWKKITTDPLTGVRYKYQRTTRARLVVEARMNGLDYDDFVHILKKDQVTAEALAFLPAEYDVHHADENPLNDEPGNLIVMLHAEHAQEHALAENNFNLKFTDTARVVSVMPIETRRTFDVEMAMPHTNFVVNDGIIVHHCLKSLIRGCRFS